MSKNLTTYSLARHIMRQHGKDPVFTNKFKKCRTVKCYARFNTGQGSGRLLEDLALIPGVTVKVIASHPWDYQDSLQSIIVRCPFEEASSDVRFHII